MKTIATLLFSMTLFVGTAAGCQSTKDSNTSVLKATIAELNLVDPPSDARRNAAQGDLRLIGVTDFACHPPGREGDELASFAEAHGLRCLAGTSDVIESKEHAELDRQVRDYGIQYNKAIVDIVQQRGL